MTLELNKDHKCGPDPELTKSSSPVLTKSCAQQLPLYAFLSTRSTHDHWRRNKIITKGSELQLQCSAVRHDKKGGGAVEDFLQCCLNFDRKTERWKGVLRIFTEKFRYFIMQLYKFNSEVITWIVLTKYILKTHKILGLNPPLSPMGGAEPARPPSPRFWHLWSLFFISYKTAFLKIADWKLAYAVPAK